MRMSEPSQRSAIAYVRFAESDEPIRYASSACTAYDETASGVDHRHSSGSSRGGSRETRTQSPPSAAASSTSLSHRLSRLAHGRADAPPSEPSVPSEKRSTAKHVRFCSSSGTNSDQHAKEWPRLRW